MNEDILNPAGLEAPEQEPNTFEVDYALPAFAEQVVAPTMPGSVIASGTYPSLTALTAGSHTHTFSMPISTNTVVNRSNNGRPLNIETMRDEMWALIQEARRSGQLEIAERMMTNMHYSMMNPF